MSAHLLTAACTLAYVHDTHSVVTLLQSLDATAQCTLLAAKRGKLMRVACRTNNEDLVQLLASTPAEDANSLAHMHTACTQGLVSAARHGRLALVHLLCTITDEHGCPMASIRGSSADTNSIKDDYPALVVAAQHAHIDVLDELLRLAPPTVCLPLCLSAAVAHNQPGVVLWVVTHGARSGMSAADQGARATLLAKAASHGDAGLDLITVMLHAYPDLTQGSDRVHACAMQQALRAAAGAGSGAMLQLLRDAIGPSAANVSVLDAAIESGNADLASAEIARCAPLLTRAHAMAACKHGIPAVVLPAWLKVASPADAQWLVEHTHSAEGVLLVLDMWPHAVHVGLALEAQLTNTREDCLPPACVVDALLSHLQDMARRTSAICAIARVLCRFYGAPQMRAFWDGLSNDVERAALRSILFELHTLATRSQPNNAGLASLLQTILERE